MRDLQLTQPLVFLDTETTGLHPKVDRIVQIGLIKVYPDGKQTEWCTFVDPTIPIPPESTEIHGISDEIVKGAPTFAKLAPTLRAGLSKCDVGGYNVWFDLDITEQEFRRVYKEEKNFFNCRIVDACDIFHKMQKRNLAAAVKFYLGEDFEDAHRADKDIAKTLRVFDKQLEVYPELPQSVEQLHRMFHETPKKGCLDSQGKFYWRYGKACVNFGTHATKPLHEVPPSFFQWMLRKDFNEDAKQIARDALKGKYPQKAKSKDFIPPAQEEEDDFPRP
jgi:DNA polymerase-3 subunit epsilon